MRGSTRLGAAALAAVLAAAGCTGGEEAERVDTRPVVLERLGGSEGELNLVAPPGHVEAGKTDPKVDWVTPFTRATGCRVSVTLAEEPDEIAELMAAGRYDGVAAPGSVSLRLVAEDRVAPVNTALIPNYRGVVPGLRNGPWNSVKGRPYGVPQGRSATLLMWRTDVVEPEPASWTPVYDPDSPYAGKVTAYDSPMTIADAAVHLRATKPDLQITDPYALDARQLEAAAALLRVQRKLVGGYWRDYTQEVPAFRDGTVVIGSTTRAIADLARAEKAPVDVTVPAEGTTGSSVTWMVATKAAHPNCMYRWMDHMLGAKTNAQAAEWLGIAPATAAACGQTFDRSYCATHHATDEAYWEKVAIQTTPQRDCRDARGETCTDYAAWRTAWRDIVR